MKQPVEFCDSPVMREDQPVHCRWAVVYSYADAPSGSSDMISGAYSDRNGAEEEARKLGRYGYQILAIVPMIYQHGDYIANFDVDWVETRRKKRKETLREIDSLSGVDFAVFNDVVDRVRLNNVDWRDVIVAQPLNLADFVYDHPAEPAPPPKVKPGDGIEAAVKWKEAQKPQHAGMAERYQRQQGMKGVRRSAQISGRSRR